MHPAGATAPDQPRHRDCGPGARALRAHPRHRLPACAQRAKTLRAVQCREGWHLETEPVIEPNPASEDQKWWIEKRAEAQAMHDRADADDEDIEDFDALNAELDQEITNAGMRGNVLPARGIRRHRTTRRRQDAAPLPRRKVAARTVGKVYETPDGKRFRPSLFVTLTCSSHGRVREDGTPADPATYDYVRAARDALHFAALFDRLVQNLRRFLGYDVQYFAAVEPQRRLAPHIHLAMRGTVSRAELRRVLAATYHQVWWPDTSVVRFEDGALPVWDEPQRPTSIRPPAKSCPPGTRPSTPSATRTSRCMWPGSGTGSTPRACWPGPRTRPAASGI